jgi:AcrR family transcriptional regulator
MVGVKGQTQQRGVERRAAIIDAALELFSETGYRSGVLTALAERVGVTGPAILHHFGSKENLLLAVMEEADRRWGDSIREVYEPGGLESLRRIRRFAEGMEFGPYMPALHLRLEVERALEATEPNYFVLRARASRNLIARAIGQGQERGEIDPALDANALAEEIHAFIDGAARSWLVDRAQSLTGMMDRYLTALEKRIAVPRKGSR